MTHWISAGILGGLLLVSIQAYNPFGRSPFPDFDLKEPFCRPGRPASHPISTTKDACIKSCRKLERFCDFTVEIVAPEYPDEIYCDVFRSVWYDWILQGCHDSRGFSGPFKLYTKYADWYINQDPSKLREKDVRCNRTLSGHDIEMKEINLSKRIKMIDIYTTDLEIYEKPEFCAEKCRKQENCNAFLVQLDMSHPLRVRVICQVLIGPCQGIYWYRNQYRY